MKPLGKAYEEAKASAGDFQRLPAGGYIARITDVEDVPDKSYLRATFDIAEGKFAGLYADQWGTDHPKAHAFIRSYKDNVLGMFKGFLKAVDESNGTKFAEQAGAGFKENQLVGKLIGIVVGYEEYMSDRGEIRERMRVVATRTVAQIRAENFKVPELKKYEAPAEAGSPVPGFEQVKDEDLPF
jgi:hypothetical protein